MEEWIVFKLDFKGKFWNINNRRENILGRENRRVIVSRGGRLVLYWNGKVVALGCNMGLDRIVVENGCLGIWIENLNTEE